MTDGPRFYADEPQGGTAFPVWHVRADGTQTSLHPGMSLRDYYAGQSMVGTCIARIMIAAKGEKVPDTINDAAAAEANYALADAMLEARDASAPGGKPS